MLSPPFEDDSAEEVQVALVTSQETDDADITTILLKPPYVPDGFPSFADEQWNDHELQPLILYLRDGELPDDVNLTKRTVVESALYTMADNILYYVGSKSSEIPRAVVPATFQQQVVMDYHSGCLAGHFSRPRLYKTLASTWWWKHMYRNALEYAENCPQCDIVKGTGRRQKPPLHPIPTE